MKKEYSILLIGLACTILAGPSLFAQGDSKPDAQFAPWALKVGGGLGGVNETEFRENKGKTNNYRISAEYNSRYFGFEFGITHKIFSLSVPPRADHVLPYALFQSAGQNNSVLNGALYSGPLHRDPLRERNNFNLTFLDIGPTFHMRPGKTFDPYLSIGAGTTGFDKSASYRGFARLGFKLNFDRFFVFTEAEASAINRYYNQDLRLHYNDYSGMIGVGFHFGGGDETLKKEETVSNRSSF
ncbi:hypothetical protein [Leptospira yasudae]|uniref:Outer membrane protein beta-barrel domain-containing protein n=1 Tax=Leptospira yasudae TaxID=2202201 RepID=A0A6N4QW16_9LEPT|nr:hypothetical protein [Leptospira yasudae]TGL75769.1 hypothetical protein EHQ72_14705 [Leptospira yasudae]TGL79049.1 hypothetical protein EHQ83_19210 [Leptospira yasudae]TGL81509.1 hypothetical protein EHQ77_05355 [Leptospira yasudae]